MVFRKCLFKLSSISHHYRRWWGLQTFIYVYAWINLTGLEYLDIGHLQIRKQMKLWKYPTWCDSHHNKTKIETLQKCKINNRLYHLDKIVIGFTPIYLQELFPRRLQQLTRYPLWNSHNFTVQPLVLHFTQTHFSQTGKWKPLNLEIESQSQ